MSSRQGGGVHVRFSTPSQHKRLGDLAAGILALIDWRERPPGSESPSESELGDVKKGNGVGDGDGGGHQDVEGPSVSALSSDLSDDDDREPSRDAPLAPSSCARSIALECRNYASRWLRQTKQGKHVAYGVARGVVAIHIPGLCSDHYTELAQLLPKLRQRFGTQASCMVSPSGMSFYPATACYATHTRQKRPASERGVGSALKKIRAEGDNTAASANAAEEADPKPIPPAEEHNQDEEDDFVLYGDLDGRGDPLPLAHLAMTPLQMLENGFPVPVAASSPGEPPRCPPGYVATQPRHLIRGGHDGASTPRLFALDCEMVCTEAQGLELARVTLLDADGRAVLDRFVKPANHVVDYVTRYSGVSPDDLSGDPDDGTGKVTPMAIPHGQPPLTFARARTLVLSILADDDVLVGHSLDNDLHALRLVHANVIDTATFFKSKRGPPYKPGLRELMETVLGRAIQEENHDSAEDARAALSLVKYAANSLNLSTSPWFVPSNDGARKRAPHFAPLGAAAPEWSLGPSIFSILSELGVKCDAVGSISLINRLAGGIPDVNCVATKADVACATSTTGGDALGFREAQSQMASAVEALSRLASERLTDDVSANHRWFAHVSLEALGHFWERRADRCRAAVRVATAEVDARLGGGSTPAARDDALRDASDAARREHLRTLPDEQARVFSIVDNAVDDVCASLPRGVAVLLYSGQGDAPSARMLQERRWDETGFRAGKPIPLDGNTRRWGADREAELTRVMNRARRGLCMVKATDDW
ncbi:REX1, RNA exonuclease 1 [Pycnococcus provasolii]